MTFSSVWLCEPDEKGVLVDRGFDRLGVYGRPDKTLWKESTRHRNVTGGGVKLADCFRAGEFFVP